MKLIKMFIIMLACQGITVTAAEAKFNWIAQGGAVLKTKQTYIEAYGNGKLAYGGLRLNHTFDLSGAGGNDYISLKIRPQ